MLLQDQALKTFEIIFIALQKRFNEIVWKTFSKRNPEMSKVTTGNHLQTLEWQWHESKQIGTISKRLPKPNIKDSSNLARDPLSFDENPTQTWSKRLENDIHLSKTYWKRSANVCQLVLSKA